MSARNIACIGEAMIELSMQPDSATAQVGVAGDTLNTAIYLRRGLAADHQVSFVSVIGRDALSDRMQAFIAGEGVSTSALRRHPERVPGLYTITTDAAGERTFSYWRENSAARTLFQAETGISFDVLAPFDTIQLSAITLAILPAEVRAALFDWIVGFRQRGGTFVFDSNYRPRLWPDRGVAQAEIARAWQLCDIALPSVDDEMAVFGDATPEAALARLLGYGLKLGALKRGAEGPLPIGDHRLPVLTYPAAAKVVDTTAAGDSFNGAFLASYLTTGDLALAMRAGHDCAAHVIGHRGAIAPRSANI